MSVSPVDEPVVPTVDPAGRYPTGTVGLVRDWDGHAWSVASTTDPDAPAYGSSRHSVFRTRRFWFAAIAVLLGAGVSGVAGLVPVDAVRITVLVIAGLLATGAALLALTSSVWQRLRVVDALATNGRRIPAFVGLGAVAGVVGFALALGCELLFSRVLRVGNVGSLFLAGPIEETAKLLVPVIAFFALGRSFRDPRVGFALVWVAAALFGLLEGIEYVAGVGIEASRHNDPLLWISGEVVDTVERSFVELMHPLMTAAAAAVMWLGAVAREGTLLLPGCSRT